MMVRLTTLSLLLTALLHKTAAVDFTNWSPPSGSDVRSPCPGLNSLANHGILPHAGKGITIPILSKALKDGLNTGADFSIAIGGAGILSVPNDPLAQSFDLADLSRHNFPIEHDASLSRADYYLDNNDNYSFNETIFNKVLSFFQGMVHTTIPVAAKAKYARVSEERARDSHFTYTPQQFVLSYGETALYLSVMGDPVTGIAPLEYVRIFFEEERLPYSEGWRPPTTETNLVTLGAMVNSLVAASGEAVPEGLLVTTNTLKLAFGGYDPVTGLLVHLL